MGADVAFFGQCQETLHSLTNLEFPNRKFHNPSSGPKLHGVRHQEQDKWVQMSPFFWPRPGRTQCTVIQLIIRVSP